MIKPTAADIGRTVIFKRKGSPQDKGVIARFNDRWVFVRFGLSGPIATNPNDLHWEPERRQRKEGA